MRIMQSDHIRSCFPTDSYCQLLTGLINESILSRENKSPMSLMGLSPGRTMLTTLVIEPLAAWNMQHLYIH